MSKYTSTFFALSTVIVTIILNGCNSGGIPDQTDPLPKCYAEKLDGIIISQPTFQNATESIDGIGLSHTIAHILTKESIEFEVAVDNIYAADFNNQPVIPQSYANAFTIGTNMHLCGRVYTQPELGIHWVHTNCGNINAGPSGYVVINNQNLTNNESYCYLFTASNSIN